MNDVLVGDMTGRMMVSEQYQCAVVDGLQYVNVDSRMREFMMMFPTVPALDVLDIVEGRLIAKIVNDQLVLTRK